jgi:hypothetical protein
MGRTNFDASAQPGPGARIFQRSSLNPNRQLTPKTKFQHPAAGSNPVAPAIFHTLALWI